MNESFKPANYSTVSPYLILDGAARTIEFLKTVFDGEQLRIYTDDNRGIVHGEVRIGDTVIMVADGVPPDWPAVPAHVYVYVEDVDETYRRALEAGAESVQEPVKKDDEDKRGAVRDSGGTTWWIATRVG